MNHIRQKTLFMPPIAPLFMKSPSTALQIRTLAQVREQHYCPLHKGHPRSNGPAARKQRMLYKIINTLYKI